MVKDLTGNEKIYGDNVANPQSFYNKDQAVVTKRFSMKNELAGIHFNLTEGGISFDSGNRNGALHIKTTSGYVSGKINKNHTENATNGYMQDKNDWKNTEITYYFKLIGSQSNDVISTRVRGGNDEFDVNSCEACGVGIQLGYDGKIRGFKARRNDMYSFTDWQDGIGDLEGRWIGYKAVFYNVGEDNKGVKYELYLDTDQSGVFRKYFEATDMGIGKLGGVGSVCGGIEGQPITFGGPIIVINWKNVTDPDGIVFKNFSVREIDHTITGSEDTGSGEFFNNAFYEAINPNFGISNTPFAAFSGVDFNAATTQTQTVPQNQNMIFFGAPQLFGAEQPAGVSGGSGANVDKWGVSARYATGRIKYDWGENFRDDGYRFDFSGMGSDWESVELIGYFRHPSPPDDEVSGKLGGGRHSGSSRPRCYDLGIDCQTGATRYRLEDRHPEYDDGQSGRGSGQGGGIGLGSNFVGYDFVKRNVSNGVLLEIWQDQGNSNGNSPANQWRKIASWVETQTVWKIPPSDHQETIRVDEISESNFSWKWISLREILDTDSSQGNTGGGIGGGTGGGAGGQNPNTPIGGGGTIGGGTGSGDGSGGTGSGTVTPAEPQEQAILYERKLVTFRWNINFYTENACDIGRDPEQLPLDPIYNVAADDYYIEGKQYRRCGIYIASESKTDPSKNSMFIGRRLRAWKFTIKRFGATGLTGLIKLRVRDQDWNIVQEIGTIDAQTVTNNDQDYDFELFNINATRQLQKGDHISLEYDDGNTQDDYLRVKVAISDKIDFANTQLFVFDGGKYIYDPNADFAGTISV